MAKKLPEQWGADFRNVRPHATAFTNDLRRLLEHHLESKGIDAQIEHRTKSVDSFVEKIHRKNEKYKDPLAEITDLCGLRVICYYLEDVASVGELIEQQFDVDWANSVRYGPESDPERFGYRSDQYIVYLSEDRKKLLEWEKYCDRCAEIQVRTIMQHAWAAVDHKIRYKGKDLPTEVRRRFSRLSALLETADEQFSSIRDQSKKVEAQYRRSIEAQDYDVSLDVLSLRGYLQSTKVTIEWAEKALELGYAEPVFWEDLQKSPEDYLTEEDLGDPLQALGVNKRHSIEAVQELMGQAKLWGEDALREVLINSKERGFTPYAVPKDILAFLALYDAENLSAVKNFTYHDEILIGLRETIRAKKKPSKDKGP
jgi:ppGpp synthetase/RelA/SpoT-type nucleotidyltranferase